MSELRTEVSEAVEKIASLASSIERDVISTIADIRRSWAELAAHLYAANQHSAWLALGYETLDEWLAQPEIDLGRRYFLQLVETYRVLHIEHGVDVNEIGRVDVTKAIVVLAAVREDQIPRRPRSPTPRASPAPICGRSTAISSQTRRTAKRASTPMTSTSRPVPPAGTSTESVADGAQLRDEAVERVERNADQRWIEMARIVVQRLSARQGHFTTDDVWVRVGSPREPRAMGAVMTWARRHKICKPSRHVHPAPARSAIAGRSVSGGERMHRDCLNCVSLQRRLEGMAVDMENLQVELHVKRRPDQQAGARPTA